MSESAACKDLCGKSLAYQLFGNEVVALPEGVPEAPAQDSTLPRISDELGKKLMASLLAPLEEPYDCKDFQGILGCLDDLSRRTQEIALCAISDQALLAEAKELLESLAPLDEPRKRAQSRRCIIFEGQIPKALIEYPPVGDGGRETRCLIIYFVAMGLAALHMRRLCHMNVKANHVEIGRDTITGSMLGRLVDDGSVVKIGAPFRHCSLSYVDQAILPVSGQIIADSAHDMWALGLFFYELMHGLATNPLHQLREPFSRDEWNAAVEQLKAILNPADPIDHIISQLLCPAKERLSAQGLLEAIEQHLGTERCKNSISVQERQLVLERIIRPQIAAALAPQEQCPLTPEMYRSSPFSEETLFLAPKDGSERQERFVIALELAKDYAAKVPFFNVRVTPQFIEILQLPKTGKTVGARLVCQAQRAEPLVDQQHCPDPNKFSFGLILFCMLFGKAKIGVELDLDHLPAPETPEWDRIVSNVRQYLGHHRIDITIDYLLTRPDFYIQSSVGVLGWILNPAAI